MEDFYNQCKKVVNLVNNNEKVYNYLVELDNTKDILDLKEPEDIHFIDVMNFIIDWRIMFDDMYWIVKRIE